MKRCYLCNDVLNSDNQSQEHIIINSIGGKLKSKGLLCTDCNQSYGEKIDAALSRELSFLTNYLGIRKDRNNNKGRDIKKMPTKNGELYDLIDGWKPVISKPNFKESKNGSRTDISISARSEKELIQILEGLRKKHPELNLEEAKKKFRWSRKYLNEPISHSISIGSDLSFRATSKTAVNAYIYAGGEYGHIESVISYIKGEYNKSIAGHFHPENIYSLEKDEIFHLVHIRGDDKEGILYAYIDFFTAHSFLVVLNNAYTGGDFEYTYCYDILKNKPIEKVVSLNLSRNNLDTFFEDKSDYRSQTAKKLQRLMKIADKIHIEKAKDQIFKRVDKDVFGDYPRNKPIPKELLEEYIFKIAEEYGNFIYHLEQNK